MYLQKHLSRALLAVSLTGVFLQPASGQLASTLVNTLAQRSTEHLTKLLKLSPDQASKIGSLNTSSMSKLADARATGDPKQMLNVFKSRNNDMKSILSKDQFTALQADRLGRATEMQTSLMAQQANLTPEQIDKVDKINRESTQSVMDTSSLSGAERKAKLESIKTSKQSALQQVMNADQWKSWSGMVEGARGKALSGGLGKLTKIPGF